MTTTPETPALLGDLTDETIERAAAALHDRQWRNSDLHPEWGERGHCMSESAHRAEVIADATAVLAAARVAPVTPSEPEWEHGTAEGEVLLARIMDALAYLHCKSMNPKADSPIMGYRAMSEDQREFLRECQRGAAEQIMRAWSAEAAPSPDREQRRALAKVIEGALAQCGISVTYAISGPAELFDVAGLVLERHPALAVPPVVNEAKLAEILGEHTVEYTVNGICMGCGCRRDHASHAEHVAAVLVERQREWRGDAR